MHGGRAGPPLLRWGRQDSKDVLGAGEACGPLASLPASTTPLVIPRGRWQAGMSACHSGSWTFEG